MMGSERAVIMSVPLTVESLSGDETIGSRGPGDARSTFAQVFSRWVRGSRWLVNIKFCAQAGYAIPEKLRSSNQLECL
jgi:hypothetical protein